MLQLVVEQVGDDAPDRQSIAEHRRAGAARFDVQRERPTVERAIVHVVAHHVVDLDQLRGQLAHTRAAGQQCIVEQANHVGDISHRALALLDIGDGIDPQAQSRREGAHVVRDAAEHRHAGLHQMRESGLQAMERGDQGLAGASAMRNSSTSGFSADSQRQRGDPSGSVTLSRRPPSTAR